MIKRLSLWCGLVALSMVMLWGCTAGAVTLDWDLNTDDTVSYNVYVGAASGSYTIVQTTTAPPHTLTLPDGEWFFVVTALDAAGNESGFSNEITTAIDTVPPMIPAFLRILP